MYYIYIFDIRRNNRNISSQLKTFTVGVMVIRRQQCAFVTILPLIFMLTSLCYVPKVVKKAEPGIDETTEESEP